MMRGIERALYFTRGPNKFVKFKLFQWLRSFRPLHSIAALLGALTAIYIGVAAPAVGETEKLPSSDTRFVVHLLDYLATDYRGAVRDGVVLSQTEYDEQLEFSGKALEFAKTIPSLNESPEVQSGLLGLRELVQEHGDADAVASLSRKLQARVIELSGLSVSPVHWPSIKQGETLFASNCTSCHGAMGDGKGPLAANLDPPPANFLDAERMSDLAPLHGFNTIRLGVPGTAMPGFTAFSDSDTWDLAFYIFSLRHHGQPRSFSVNEAALKEVATMSDRDLSRKMSPGEVSALRVYTPHAGAESYLSIATEGLDRALAEYLAGDVLNAKTYALHAYLEGIEPIEPRLRATDPELVSALERSMSGVRAEIGSGAPIAEIQKAIAEAKADIVNATELLKDKPLSPLVAFFGAAGVLLREGFEAVLVIVALLGVTRASGATKAVHYIHFGWVLAIFAGVAAWIASGYLVIMSGASRELMEGATSLLAVAMLLAVGFWLHSQTEIQRWKTCIECKVRKSLEGNTLYGLTLVAFIAVFREALETVLFLRAIWTESGDSQKTALAFGVGSSALLILGFTWALIRYSTKIPIKRLFTISALIMAALSVILAGKGIHSLQETGAVSVTTFPITLRWELFGVYPTYESILLQLATFIVAAGLWKLGSRPASKPKSDAPSDASTESSPLVSDTISEAPKPLPLLSATPASSLEIAVSNSSTR